jgi:hypothetical protein
MEWNESKEKRLERLIREGKTYSEIAELFNVSRNTIIGKSRRMNFESVYREVQFGSAEIKSGREKLLARPIKSSRDRSRAVSMTRIDRLGLRFQSDSKVEGRELSKTETCQWLHGEASERNFCPNKAEAFSAWCPEHRVVVYVRSNK